MTENIRQLCIPTSCATLMLDFAFIAALCMGKVAIINIRRLKNPPFGSDYAEMFRVRCIRFCELLSSACLLFPISLRFGTTPQPTLTTPVVEFIEKLSKNITFSTTLRIFLEYATVTVSRWWPQIRVFVKIINETSFSRLVWREMSLWTCFFLEFINKIGRKKSKMSTKE